MLLCTKLKAEGIQPVARIIIKDDETALLQLVGNF